MSDDILGTDVALVNGDLAPTSAGDAALVAGSACLAQDLAGLLSTARGTLWMHPEWGFDLARFAHIEDLAVHRLDFCQSVQEAVEMDPRVVPGSARCTVKSWADSAIRFELTVLPIGETNPLNLVLLASTSTNTVEVVSGDA